MSSNACYGRTNVTATVDVSWLLCVQGKSELNKRCCSRLSSVFIYPVWMHTVYTQILTDRLSWSGPKPVPTDKRGFVSITHMGKQRSPISIVHWSPVNALGDRDDAITGYSTISSYCIVGTFGLVRMWWDHIPRGFILQFDWLLKIWSGNGRQKMYGSAIRPLSRFFGRCLGTRLTLSMIIIQLVCDYSCCQVCLTDQTRAPVIACLHMHFTRSSL